MKAIMHRTEGTVNRLGPDTQRRIRDLARVGQQNGMTLERASGSFAFEIGVKSEEGWETRRIVRGRGLE